MSIRSGLQGAKGALRHKAIRCGLAVVGFLLAACLGCRSTPPVPADAAVEAPAAEAPGTAPLGPRKAELWDEKPLVVDAVLPEREPGFEARTALPERRTPAPAAPVSEYPANLIKGIPDPESKVEVNLNFDAIQMTELIEAFAQLLQFSYLVDPAVAGKGAVTINIESEMTARETWETFEHILWLAGAYASRNPGFIHILPFEKMPKERRLLFQHDILANVEVALIPVRYRKSGDIAGLIEPFKTDGATIKDLTDGNTLLLVEAPANMPKLRELIAQLDNRGEAAWPHVCLPCRHADAEEILKELESLLPVLGFPVVNKGPSGGAVKLTALPRLQVIVASAAMVDVLEEVERWVRVLDTADTLEKENIYWYNVKHSTAEQLKETLDVFFNAQSTTGARPSRTKSTSAKATPTAGSAAPSPTPAPIPTARPSAAQPAEVTGTIFDTPVVVLVDQVRERLTIRTTQRAYALIQALLERQDVAPRQVYIQAMIAEIILTEGTEFGFSYAAKNLISRSGDALGVISAGSGAIPAALPTDTFAFLFSDRKGDPLAFIRAVAGEGNTRILSEPQVVVLSGEEAKIDVGERVPIPTESTSYSGTLDNFRTNYQYENTGVILTVTPYVTAGNDVRLEVRQEVSDAAPSENAQVPPRITNKVIESVLSIPDGNTVMMGGLIRTKATKTHSGWPLLKDIPGVGGLFRTNRTTDERGELLVLLTVNVIETASQMEHLVQRFRESIAEVRARERERQ